MSFLCVRNYFVRRVIFHPNGRGTNVKGQLAGMIFFYKTPPFVANHHEPG